ncbi:DJ-1/PfpI family protein [Oculatella sp. FACHB-28]|uniref:DJ-1/PfpI family protein n=1 Tax=Oculatella sp. FACHB-28 TaxID=2692845 RepID=UPI0016835D8A|nr:DJ-1/PfpI family protein [Oculatella sp. FACHB-28]MBD2058539.1 DJ-1/PfpI family protein [Oculatella sp. FACHB-28]
MVQIQIIVFDGFDELDAIAPFEVLQTAAAMGADVQAKLVTLDGSTEIVAAHGLRVQPGAKLRDQLDILIVPGGGWGDRAKQGAWAEAQSGKIPAAISQLHQSGTTIASVCTGGMLVASAGLLRGRPAITHHVAIEELKAMGAEIVNARVVDDGDIVTAGGVTSGIDLSLWLLERYLSPQIAYEVEQELEYERRGVVWQQLKTPSKTPSKGKLELPN